MGAFDELDKVPRRTLVLFFVVDTSGSMDGEKIGQLNVAVQEVIPMISRLSSNNADAQIKIAALEFSSQAEWMYDMPIEAEQFQWRDLEAQTLTNLGAACDELNKKLSTKGFMNEAAGSFAPAIILMSDGEPTGEYKRNLEKLKENNWFKASIKVAIAIGDDANKDVLAEFAGHKECVLTVHNKEQLEKIIHFVSVTASQVASKSASVGQGAPETKTEEMIEKIEHAQENDLLAGADVGTETTTPQTDDWGDGWS